MKPETYIALTASVVLFGIGILSKNTIAQFILVLTAFVCFEVWIHFVKHDREHKGH